MLVWLSEFTYKRLVDGSKVDIPIHTTNSHGFVRVDVDDAIIKSAVDCFGPDIDQSLNKVINHNQKSGHWPKPPFTGPKGSQ